MRDQTLTNDLTAMLTHAGAALVGVADITILPADVRHHLPLGVVFAMPIAPAIAATLAHGPTQDYADEYDRLNRELGRLAQTATAFLEQRGFRAVAQSATVKELNRVTLSEPLPHKTLATRAGLGWIGKCALLVTPTHGSAIRMNSLLTDAPLTPGTPIETSRCGDCEQCRILCPGAAPTGSSWHAGLPRSDFFNAFACLAAARKLAGEMGISHIICGRCIAACPHTQKYLAGLPAA